MNSVKISQRLVSALLVIVIGVAPVIAIFFFRIENIVCQTKLQLPCTANTRAELNTYLGKPLLIPFETMTFEHFETESVSRDWQQQQLAVTITEKITDDSETPYLQQLSTLVSTYGLPVINIERASDQVLIGKISSPSARVLFDAEDIETSVYRLATLLRDDSLANMEIPIVEVDVRFQQPVLRSEQTDLNQALLDTEIENSTQSGEIATESGDLE